MNEELTKKLIQLIESAQNFTVENAPLYAKELLAYGAFDHTLWMWISGVVGVLLFILSIAMFLTEIAEGVVIGSVLVFLMVIGFGVSSVTNYSELKKIEKAPRVYILEKLKK